MKDRICLCQIAWAVGSVFLMAGHNHTTPCRTTYTVPNDTTPCRVLYRIANKIM